MKKGDKILFIGDPDAVKRDAHRYQVALPIPNPEKVYTHGGNHPKGGMYVDELPFPKPELSWQHHLWIKLEDAIFTNQIAADGIERIERECLPGKVTAMERVFTLNADF
jgi:hypothetical protein